MSDGKLRHLVNWSTNHIKLLIPRHVQAEKAQDVIDYEIWMILKSPNATNKLLWKKKKKKWYFECQEINLVQCEVEHTLIFSGKHSQTLPFLIGLSVFWSLHKKKKTNYRFDFQRVISLSFTASTKKWLFGSLFILEEMNLQLIRC